jgi:hypothetical protein
VVVVVVLKFLVAVIVVLGVSVGGSMAEELMTYERDSCWVL